MLQVLDRSGGHVDLSPLRKSSGNWVTKPSPTGVQYHINVCGPLNPVLAHNCSGMKCHPMSCVRLSDMTQSFPISCISF